ncbi:hypothetical protein [Cerasicoccus frondis]|uniref:hypothetical protein n=1 Tax=Cerasicoccus frondis TaxID=490090 RepID=UPI002852D1A7|nr:hypothetical protein [Cerasicoccus frondis]
MKNRFIILHFALLLIVSSNCGALNVFSYIDERMFEAIEDQEESISPRILTIIDKYRHAVVGNKQADHITSLLVTGSLETKEGVSTFRFLLLRPNLLRFDVISSDGFTAQVYDGNWGWFMEERGGHKMVRWMSESESETMCRDSVFFSYLMDASRQDISFSLLSSTSELIGIQAELKGGDCINYWLDPETFLISREVKVNAGESGFLVIDYSDYREVNGCMFSFLAIHSLYGRKVTEVKIDHISTNADISLIPFTAPILNKPQSYSKEIDMLEEVEFAN